MTPTPSIPAEAVEARIEAAAKALAAYGLPLGNSIEERRAQLERTWHRFLPEAEAALLAADAALPHLTPTAGEGVAVKALEWSVPYPDHTGYVSIYATGILGRYEVYCMGTGRVWHWELSSDDDTRRTCDSENEAKAACQADYETRIRSALIPSPADTSASAVVEAAREILKHAGIHDASPDDVDEEDRVRECNLRNALAALASSKREG